MLSLTGLDIKSVGVRLTPRRYRLVLALIRENGSMNQRRLTLGVMEHRRLKVADAVLRGVARNWVRASLQGLKKRRTLARGSEVRWGLQKVVPPPRRNRPTAKPLGPTP